MPGPVTETTGCFDPNAEGTCPTGCVLCECASPETRIATPDGDKPIAALTEGDLVYSVVGQAFRAVPIVQTHACPAAAGHRVVRVALEGGAVVEMSAGHPTANGRTFGDLRRRDVLDGARIVEVESVPFAHAFTHDILPASDTGTYVAGGVLVGSTLHGRTRAVR